MTDADLQHAVELSRVGVEIWAPIPGYEGSYEASNLGRVRSMARTVRFKSGLVADYPTLVLRTKPVGKVRPYLAVAPSKDGIQKNMYVHHAVLAAFAGPMPEGMETRHLDNDRHNNALYNIVYGTRTENWQDKIKANSIPHGCGHYKSKLTPEQVAAIKAKTVWLRGEKKAMAVELGVSLTVIWQIAHGVSYAPLMKRRRTGFKPAATPAP